VRGLGGWTLSGWVDSTLSENERTNPIPEIPTTDRPPKPREQTAIMVVKATQNSLIL
jgi:hypothetical protein